MHNHIRLLKVCTDIYTLMEILFEKSLEAYYCATPEKSIRTVFYELCENSLCWLNTEFKTTACHLSFSEPKATMTDQIKNGLTSWRIKMKH